jgi:CubicO group peptidase (beta-lactamase class C family)
MTHTLNRRTAAAFLALTPLAACASTRAQPNAYERLERFLERLAALEFAPPGFTVSVVTRDSPPLTRAWGVRDASTGAPIRTDTPVYIASMTKAFVGLMAVALEQRGTFNLDRTLADYFPNARLPAPLDPATISFRQLLSHCGHLSNEYLQHRTANTDDVPVSEYARLLSIGTEYREQAFRYTNAGYLLYGAALELETGRSWRDHLHEAVLRPLRLSTTSARASNYAPNAPARGHQRTRDGWFTLPPKGDATMHAAGGMFSTAEDMTNWLRAHLEPSGRLRSAIAQSHQRLATFPPEPYFATIGEGYSYGWIMATYRNLRLFHHGGTFTGFRAQMSFAPDLGVGVAVLVPTDHLGGQFAAIVTEAAYDFLREDVDADARAEARISTFDADTRSHLDQLIARHAQVWGFVPREWSPTRAELDVYVGRCVSEGYGAMVVENAGDHLLAHMGVQTLRLVPGVADNFAGHELLPHAIPERFEFRRDETGVITSVQWAEWGLFTRAS